jgi:hypothetical protein
MVRRRTSPDQGIRRLKGKDLVVEMQFVNLRS